MRLYFVVETKIACGKAHFHALAVGENPARYVVERSVVDLLAEAATIFKSCGNNGGDR